MGLIDMHITASSSSFFLSLSSSPNTYRDLPWPGLINSAVEEIHYAPALDKKWCLIAIGRVKVDRTVTIARTQAVNLHLGAFASPRVVFPTSL